MKIDSVYKEALKVTFVVFILGVIEFILFTVFMGLRIDVLFGVLYGCTFVSANFFYLTYSVKKCVGRNEKSAKAYMSGTYSTRMLLTAVMIIVAAKVKYIYFWAAIIPLLLQRVAIHIVSLLSSYNKKGSENS